MPLAEHFKGKGKEVKEKMKKRYGKKKGEKVFHATTRARKLEPSEDFKKKHKLD